MEKQSKIRHLPFLNAMNRAQKRYGLEMKQDEFIEEGYNVWREIGNQAPVLTRFFTKVPEDYIIELPPGCEFIESVVIMNEPERLTTFDSEGKKDRTLPAYIVADNEPTINQSLETSKYGKSVNYILVGENAIKLTSADTVYRDIMIVYRSLLVNEDDGLPLLNDKEVAAIAAEVTRREVARQAFQGIKGKAEMLSYIEKEANRLMAAAKIDEYINDDAIDQILDIKTTFDRKVYGRRYNPLN